VYDTCKMLSGALGEDDMNMYMAKIHTEAIAI
jgi:hypothetical protein